MKKTLLNYLLVIIIVTAIIVAGAYAFKTFKSQNLSAKDTALAFLIDWVEYEGNPVNDQLYKTHSLVSADFSQKTQTTIDAFSYSAFDPVLCAQDKPQGLEVLSVSELGDEVSVLVREIYSGGDKTIEVILEKNEVWKIKDIICQEGDLSLDLNNSVSPAIQTLVGDYIRDNINDLSTQDPVLGGNFYVTSVVFTGPYSGIVDYEDGHIALRALFNFKVPDSETVEIENFQVLPEREDKVNFSKAGNLVERDGAWQLVYEEPGKPALTKSLNFDQSSKCFLNSEPRLCEPAFWQAGDRVEISGLKSDEEVLVYSLNIVLSPDEKTVGADDLSFADCVALGNEVLYPECLGCQPYCETSDGKKIEKPAEQRGCIDKCGDGVCQEMTCMATTCPCSETAQSCPEDCN
ncbi:MAG: hypothetical protein K9M44_03835 [Candidatus Pacebacteria bacterium]|nr:hypothetical protein [Candidatus Paceibacterota bacterium]